jgi:ABC-type antimicrobial peptide transport system permease subunit
MDRMSEYLKETFPEIDDAITVFWSFQGDKVVVDGRDYPASTILADTSVFRMFDVRVLEGSHEFLIRGSNKVAITQQKARKLFGDENPIGKTIYRGHIRMEEFTICAIVSDLPKRSNFAFDFISPSFGGGVTIIRLYPGINVNSFQQKLYEHEITEQGIAGTNFIIKPITQIRYTDPDMRRDIKFQYIVIFAVSGLLIILCALFNYLTLFVSRFRIRQKELALRMVCGASGRSLLTLLSVEFLLTLLYAVVLGSALTQWLHKPFLTMSGIQMDLSAIFLESLVYIGCIIVFSLFVFWLILIIFRHRSLNVSIRRSNNNFSRKVSVVAQLVISIGFAFCSIVIMRQIHFLHHTDDLGFSFKNRGRLPFVNQL